MLGSGRAIGAAAERRTSRLFTFWNFRACTELASAQLRQRLHANAGLIVLVMHEIGLNHQGLHARKFCVGPREAIDTGLRTACRPEHGGNGVEEFGRGLGCVTGNRPGRLDYQDFDADALRFQLQYNY
jgi:hypothetical protein